MTTINLYLFVLKHGIIRRTTKAESSGEFIANLLGLNEGPFTYVTDSMTEDQMASSQRRLDEQSSSSSSIVGEQQKKDDNDDVGV